jgi:hypothetical protein
MLSHQRQQIQHLVDVSYLSKHGHIVVSAQFNEKDQEIHHTVGHWHFSTYTLFINNKYQHLYL